MANPGLEQYTQIGGLMSRKCSRDFRIDLIINPRVLRSSAGEKNYLATTHNSNLRQPLPAIILMQNIKGAWKRMKYAVSKKPRPEKFSFSADYNPSNETESLINADKNGMVIHGHDYTNAEFVIIDAAYKDGVIPTLQKVNVISLLILTRPTGPGGRYRGVGWCDLFAERTNWDKVIWPRMAQVCRIAEQVPMNEDCMFCVWFCPPGLIHIELDDDGTWSVHDVLSMPQWMLIG